MNLDRFVTLLIICFIFVLTFKKVISVSYVLCLVSNETTLDGLFAAARSARVRPRGGGGGGGAAAGRGGRQRARHRQRQRHRQPTPRR